MSEYSANPNELRRVISHLRSVVTTMMEALESDASLGQRREAFDEAQKLFEPGEIFGHKILLKRDGD